jgi:hypothetical protein
MYAAWLSRFEEDSELNQKREVLRLDLVALLLPQADQGLFILAHDDAGVGTADDEVTAIGIVQSLH